MKALREPLLFCFLSLAIASNAFAKNDGIYICTPVKNEVAACGNKNAPEIGTKTGCNGYRFDSTFKFTKKGGDIRFDGNFIVGNTTLSETEVYWSDDKDIYAASYDPPYNEIMQYTAHSGQLMYTTFNNYTIMSVIGDCMKY